MAKQYLQLIKQQLSAANSAILKPKITSENRECILWKTKKPTQIDHEATLAFLALRKQFDAEFADKKNSKNFVWSKIVNKMNEMGFVVGDGVEGREKLRQKFANMTAMYIKTIQKRNNTGEGKITYPLYFDEMDDILGDKHKVTPLLVIDSASEESTSSTESVKCTNPYTLSTEESSPKSSSKADQVNRFRSIKHSVRPKKQTVVDVLEKMHKESLENRKNEFKIMIDTLHAQNQQRHEQMMALIANMNKSKRNKRRRDSDSD